MKNIILFELNEVPSRIIQYYCKQRPGSALSRIFPSLRVYETHAEDRVLSPWVTWPSLHRGVTDAKHHIHNFGQPLGEIDKEFPPIWQRLAERGYRVGVFGSLHTYPLPKKLEQYDFFVPDTFAAGSECFPEKLDSFQEFNLTMARASARSVSTTVPWKAALKFLASLPDLGIKAGTVGDVTHQLLQERLDHAKTCRRRTYQVVLAFDIFMKQLSRNKPHFCTFFTNHVASSMHRYWAAAFPEDYSSFTHSPDWIDTYQNEIMFTMSKFDEMLKRLVTFVDRNKSFELWIATSMGQEATTAEPCESELFVSNDARFALFFNLNNWQRKPAMVPDFGLLVAEEQVSEFEVNLKKLYIAGEPVRFKRVDNFFSLGFGHANQKGKHAIYNGTKVEFSELGMENQIIEDQTGATAYHMPTGCLLIYGGSPLKGNEVVSTTDVHAAILKNYGLGNGIEL
jgi:hypothetical protein